jgi:outer membrane lipoprotein-sorting protein
MGGLLEMASGSMRAKRHVIRAGLRFAIVCGIGLFAPEAQAAPAVPAPASASAVRAREIVDRVDRLLRGESSRGELEMQIVTEHWQRTLRMRVWSLGTDRALVQVTAPPRESGTGTLKVGSEVWSYLPRVARTIKVPASMMMGSWMGSHFTNDDLVKESRMIDDYDIAISFEGERDGILVWEFTLTPHPEAAVVWGRVVELVRQDDLMPLWARYYDEDGALQRTMTFGEVKIMGGRRVPTVITTVPAEKPTERTVLRYRELEFDVGLKPSFFSLQNLQSVEPQ